LEASLISECVTAGMKAARDLGKHQWRPATSRRGVSEIEEPAASTDLSIRQIQRKIAGRGTAALSARSPNAPTPNNFQPCDHFYTCPELTLVRWLRTPAENQISGFDSDCGVLDLRSTLVGMGVDLIGHVAAMSNDSTIASQAAGALLRFDPTGDGGGATLAVSRGWG